MTWAEPIMEGVQELEIHQARWWRCFFDNAEDPQMVLDRDGTVLELNKRASQLFGGAATWQCQLSEVFTTAALQKIRNLFRRSNFSETLASVSIQLEKQIIMLADVQVMHLSEDWFLLSMKDASRRWRLESHAHRLMTAIESARDVVFITNEKFHITFANSATQEVTGYSIEDIIGRKDSFLRAPFEASKIATYLKDVQQGLSWTGELINIRADGSQYRVETSVSPVYDSSGALIGYSTLERDVTERYEMQKSLIEQRNFARSILNSIDAVVYTLDSSFLLTDFNDSFHSFQPEHGWLKFEAPPQKGVNFLDYVVNDAKREELSNLFKEVLSGGQSREFRETRGNKHWSIKITSWRTEGRISGLIYKVTDHTEFAELQNQLYQAQKMETVGSLAAGIAHDFNNLILVMRGYTTLAMMDEAIPEDSKSSLKEIEKAAGQAAGITQQLLSFSRITDEVETILDFNQVITEASELAGRTLRNRTQITLYPHSEPLRVRMDATRAQQVLLNLCVNAQDAMSKGGTLEISNSLVELTQTQANKAGTPLGAKFVRCSVADSGTGIPSDVLTRIFNPFFTTKEKGKGTGLGLAIVHNVISKAGGIIEVDTVLGKGTTFHVFLPAVLDEHPVATKMPGARMARGSGNVMVVDDLELVCDFATRFLQAAGYDVFCAMSVDEALKILERRQGKMDLILTDYSMPEKTGLQLIDIVKQQYPAIKLILATGYLEDKERTIIEQTYQIGILNKPYNISEASDLISRTIQQS